MNKNNSACIIQQDRCLFLFTETCKLILTSSCFTCIFEIGYILLQHVLTELYATWP